jgi:hypothetical protein
VASAPPSASRIFIILAGEEGEASRGSTSRMGRRATSSFSIQGRALTGLAEGADFDNAGPVGRKRRQLRHAWLAGSAGSGAASGATSHRWGRVWLFAHRTGGYCVVRIGGPSKTSHATRVAFVFLDCLVLTPARRLRADVGACPSART